MNRSRFAWLNLLVDARRLIELVSAAMLNTRQSLFSSHNTRIRGKSSAIVHKDNTRVVRTRQSLFRQSKRESHSLLICVNEQKWMSWNGSLSYHWKLPFCDTSVCKIWQFRLQNILSDSLYSYKHRWKACFVLVLLPMYERFLYSY